MKTTFRSSKVGVSLLRSVKDKAGDAVAVVLIAGAVGYHWISSDLLVTANLNQQDQELLQISDISVTSLSVHYDSGILAPEFSRSYEMAHARIVKEWHYEELYKELAQPTAATAIGRIYSAPTNVSSGQLFLESSLYLVSPT